ncbi:hypothetical protein NPIL_447351 [Nephila pilipes]|uniref:Uncharacterized protein n=1 Tax=Nephila pilipes TaxID=299642 RepID=A0A8X6P014_NEPPI|nr:hypothetical protein NPIL_447351 [Nephila pilipes]
MERSGKDEGSVAELRIGKDRRQTMKGLVANWKIQKDSWIICRLLAKDGEPPVSKPYLAFRIIEFDHLNEFKNYFKRHGFNSSSSDKPITSLLLLSERYPADHSMKSDENTRYLRYRSWMTQ